MKQTLSASPRRASTASDKVLRALRQADAPLSAYALLDKLRRQGLRAPPQIYRALGRLIQCGAVHKIESLNAYIACAKKSEEKQGPPQSLFALCRVCGAAQEIDDPALLRALKLAGSPFLAKQTSYALEIAGLCARCAARQASPSS